MELMHLILDFKKREIRELQLRTVVSKKAERILSLFVTLMCIFFLTPTMLHAENGKEVLDKVSDRLKKAGGIEANFIGTNYKDNKEVGRTTGTISIQDTKFKIEAKELTIWFDGATQWSLLSGSDEAYASTPTQAELQSINPYTFINLYKSGYQITLKSATYSGKSVHEVRMLAQKKNMGIQEMLILVDPATYLPLNVRIRDARGNWIRIIVNGIKTGKKWDDSFFRFNKSEHSGVEVIDLR